jgi:hypothetical protein
VVEDALHLTILLPAAHVEIVYSRRNGGGSARLAPASKEGSYGRGRMKAIVGVLIAATLAVGSGCARKDWIDRTLVTEDVTGTWYRSLGGLGGPYDRGGLC